MSMLLEYYGFGKFLYNAYNYVKKINTIMKILFLKRMYQNSHNIYLKEYYSQDFSKLYKDIDFSIRIGNIYITDRFYDAELFLKSEIEYDSIKILITIDGNGCVFSEEVTIYKLNNSQKHHKNLTQIPIQYIKRDTDGLSYRPYSKISIEILELTQNGVKIISDAYNAYRSTFTYSDIVDERDWDIIGDKIFNIHDLNCCRKYVRSWCVSKLFTIDEVYSVEKSKLRVAIYKTKLYVIENIIVPFAGSIRYLKYVKDNKSAIYDGN